MGINNSKIHAELKTCKNENYNLKVELEELTKLNKQLQDEIYNQNNSNNSIIIKLKEKNIELNHIIYKHDEYLDSYPELKIKSKKVSF
jgi:hypothetical protein